MTNVNVKAQELFNEQFKFKINQEVRHKGDNKNGGHSDMGLLVLKRLLEEECDDDGNSHFVRNYVCRMIRFSGSGDLARFKESELMTITDYNIRAIEDEREREEMRNQMYNTEKEVFDSFGVKRGTEVHLANGNNVDKENIYKVSGFSTDKYETLLHLRKVIGEGKTVDMVKVKSKSEFQVIKPF